MCALGALIASAFLFACGPENSAVTVQTLTAADDRRTISMRLDDDADICAEPAMYPSAEVRQRLFSYTREATDFERQRLRLWEAMKAGQPLN